MEAGGVQLSLSATSTSYSVGETVTAVLHALPSEDIWTDLQDLEIVFCGVERVDTAWVSRTYRKSIAAINDDKRRVQRLVVLSRLQAATQGNFSDADFRRFIIRFNLPSWLPPSYKGTAVRYSYYMEAIMRYRKEAPDPSLQLPPTDIDSEICTTSIRFPILIWPGKEAGFSALPPPSPSFGDPAATGSDVFPALASDTVAIKCWEIGPGTAIDDAIAHITKLGSSMNPSTSMGSMPQTPSFLHREDSRIENSESASEISSQDDSKLSQQQQQQQQQQLLRRPSALLPADSLAAGAELPTSTVQAELGAFKSFSLRTGPHQLARISVQPPLEGVIRPGCTFGGTVEFPLHVPLQPSASQGENDTQQNGKIENNDEGSGLEVERPKCTQLSLLLESEESVNAAWQPSGKASGSGAQPLRRLHDEQVDATSNLACTSFLFTLPQDATPTFSTQVVGLKWGIRFQFVVMHPDGRTEQLEWSLPIAVEPPT